MGYIYIIRNKINDKVYIGKTNVTIEQRFRDHIYDSKKRRCEKRPLYSAMRKYGADQFYIELIEETNDTSNREKYWIAFYNSYHYGYNATIGGDGSEYVNRKKIIELYEQCRNIAEVQKQTGHDQGTIRQILKNANIPVYWDVERVRKERGRHVAQIDVKSKQIIAVYLTLKEAIKAIGGKTDASLYKALKSKSKYALGYLWQEITYEEYEQFTRNNNSSSENSQDNKCTQMDI